MTARATALGAAVLALGLAAGSLGATSTGSAEQAFLARFEGNWQGSGTVQRKAGDTPWNVACQVAGQPDADRISVAGSCRAAVIVTRQIGVDLAYDAASGRYSGTYIGSLAGPAHLDGTRRGDAVDLSITWAKPYNGDTHARMTIVNNGQGSLRILVDDNLQPGGPIQQTSDLVLTRT